MQTKYFHISFICLMFFAACLSVGTCKAQTPERLSQETVLYYFDMILSGNYESAGGLWEASLYDRSTRLGIEYDNIPMKIDCNSPVINDFERMKKYILQGVISHAELEDDLFRWMFRGKRDEKTVTYHYYTVKIDDYFWLTTVQDYYTRDWLTKQSKYFRFYVNPKCEANYNEVAVRVLDRFVEDVAEKIGLDANALELLAEKKIDYYLCLSKTEIAKMSSRRVRGYYDPATDAVFSIYLPHFAEVAQLLINYRLRKLPLYTLPIVQKGLAASLGGRWQRSADVVNDFGAYILRYDVVDLDSILTYDMFLDSAEGDIAYPASTCLIRYLYSRLQPDKFFKLYRVLSGDKSYVTNLSADDIKSIISSAVSQDWVDFKSDFIATVKNVEPGQSAGVGPIRPGYKKGGRELLNNRGGGLKLSATDEWLVVEFQSENDSLPVCTIFFDKSPEMTDKISRLFNEQFQHRLEYEGYRYGIKLDKNEIGLYDYATSRIIAKYIDNARSDTDYFDQDKNKVTAVINLDLLEGVIPDFNEYRIIK